MIIQPATLDAINFAFVTRFGEAYRKRETFYEKICTAMPSLGRENRYAWPDRLPRMREWLGEKVLNNISLREFTIVNKDFEDTLVVDRNQIKDDQIGVLSPSVDMLGEEAKILPDRLVSDLLHNGDSSSLGVCFDGQSYFNTAHPTDIDNPTLYATQSNLFAATPLSALNFSSVRAKMRSFKGKDNLPLGVVPNLLMVHPDQEEIAREIATGEFIPGTVTEGAVSGAASKSNVWKGQFDIVVNPYLTDSGVWYLLATGMPVKPIAYQTREAAMLIPLINPTDSNVFFQRKFIWSVESRENGGYSLWFLAAKCLPT